MLDKVYYYYNVDMHTSKVYAVYIHDCKHFLIYTITGEAGVVYKAFLETKNGRDLVAIKTVKGNCTYYSLHETY